MSTPDRTLESRIRALEENQGFAERVSEQLGDEVRELGRRVLELAQRLSRVEAKVAGQEPPSGNETDDSADGGPLS